MPILYDGSVLVLILTKGNDTARSELERQREEAFKTFLQDLYGVEPERNIQQLKKLLDHLYGEIEKKGIVKNKGGKLRAQRKGRLNDEDLGLVSLKEAFDEFPKVSFGDSEKIVLDCKDMLERIAYLIIHDGNNSDDLKESTLLDLIDPLVECKEGAQGQVQNKYVVLNSLSLEQQLGLFAKDIVEKIFLKDLREDRDGEEQRGNVTIHTRNGYFWYAYTKGLSILGPVEKDKYTGGLTESGAMAKIRSRVDSEYSMGNFLDSITSSIRSGLSDIKLQFNATQKYKERVLKCLAFIDVKPEELDSLFSSKIKMPYTALSAFLTRIHEGEISSYSYVIDMSGKSKDDASHFYILNKEARAKEAKKAAKPVIQPWSKEDGIPPPPPPRNQNQTGTKVPPPPPARENKNKGEFVLGLSIQERMIALQEKAKQKQIMGESANKPITAGFQGQTSGLSVKERMIAFEKSQQRQAVQDVQSSEINKHSKAPGLKPNSNDDVI